MNRSLNLLLWILALVGLGSLFVQIRGVTEPARELPAPILAPAHDDRPVQPLPAVPALDPARVALGRALFHDTRLSRDGSVSCASCHLLASGGHDPRPLSQGVGGALGSVNAPTVLNASLNFSQFWDGRAGSLEEQAHGPVNNPVEMATTWPEVIAKLNADTGFRAGFEAVYAGGLTPANIVDAIATFERTLLTPDAPFDRFLRGDTTAMDAMSQEGFRRFSEIGCISCHQGVNLGGNMYQRFGILGDYLADRPRSEAQRKADLGRFNVTGLASDRYVFKVPGLRNVALTAPYFHDGSAANLHEAIAIMGRYQLGRELDAREIDTISAFLHALTGALPAADRP